MLDREVDGVSPARTAGKAAAGKAPRRIAIIGNLEVDLVLGPLPRMPQWGEERIVARRERRAAGSAGYTAIALGHLGHCPLLVGPLGSDEEGELIRAALKQAGLSDEGLIPSADPTGLSVTLVREDGERAFVNHLGALQTFSPADVQAHWDQLSQADVVLVSGYFLLPAFRGAPLARLFRLLQDEGIVTALDTGDAVDGWTDEVRAEMRQVLAATDWLFPNEAEACGMTGCSRWEEAACELLGLGPKQVIVRRGSQGAAAVSGSGVVEGPVFPVQVVDTVGAGDTFNAGFLAAWAEGRSEAEALAYGAAAAALYISSPQRAFPTGEQVRRLFVTGGRSA